MSEGRKFSPDTLAAFWHHHNQRQGHRSDSPYGCRYGYPAFIALNPKEAKYGALRESFDLEHAAEFIERLRQVWRDSLLRRFVA